MIAASPRRLLCFPGLLLGGILLGPAAGWAQEPASDAAPPSTPAPGASPVSPPLFPDFAPGNPYWNGLTGLIRLLREQGIEVETPPLLDWQAVAGRGLLLLDPATAPDSLPLEQFLQAGGRVVLGVERGPARETLLRYGLQWEERAPRATLTHEGRPSLPFALPVPEPGPAGDASRDHPLTRGEPLVLANHARMLVGGGRGLFSYAGPGAGELLREVEVEQGRLVGLADPSVLINNMLEFPGNRQLAANLGAYLCPAAIQPADRLPAGADAGGLTVPARPAPDGSCRILLFTGSFEQRAGLRDDLDRVGRQARERLARLDALLTLDGARLWLLTLLLLGGALFGVLLRLPQERREPPVEVPWTVGELEFPADLTSRTRALEQAPAGADLRLGLAMLAEQVRPQLRRHLGGGSPVEQLAAFLRRHGEPPGGEVVLASFLTALATAPPRDDLYAPGTTRVSLAELRELIARWEALRQVLEARGRRRPPRSER